ncbi:hypothetical protein D3C85_1425800 [compost metagenome]
MQDDIQHRVYSPRRQGFGTRDKIGRGVAQQHVQRPATPDFLHHGLDRLAVAHVHSYGSHLRPGDGLAELRRRGLQHIDTAPGDHQLRAEFQVAPAYALAQAGAATCNQNFLSCQKVACKHGFSSR